MKQPKLLPVIKTILAVALCVNLSQQVDGQAELTPTASSVTVSSVDGQEVPANQASLNQAAPHRSPLNSRQFPDMINDIHIECNSDNIIVTLSTSHGFNGMIYPKGLSKNSTCMTEYHQTSANITYYLPLKSCNTMSSEVEDGIEYFNTVMVQPHRRLVTNQGRGYHIRCRYQTRERTITNQEQQLSVNLTQSTPAVIGSPMMPSCSMKIYSANDLSREVAAENVRIGDELHLVISLADQDVYGMLVTNCLVRDGLNWGEQPLLDDIGCPVDEEIMPEFSYSSNLTRASVTFQAHKFPYTSSVYYQCNVRLCFREGGCANVPPNCGKKYDRNFRALDSNNEILTRNKRWLDGGDLEAVASSDVASSVNPKTMSIEVSSGLNVDETVEPAANSESLDPMMAASTSDDSTSSAAGTSASDSTDQATPAKNRQSDKEFCLSLRKFAIAISLASLLLMLAVIIMIACIIHRRKRRKEEEARYAQSSAYDRHSPYSNRAYCRD